MKKWKSIIFLHENFANLFGFFNVLMRTLHHTFTFGQNKQNFQNFSCKNVNCKKLLLKFNFKQFFWSLICLGPYATIYTSMCKVVTLIFLYVCSRITRIIIFYCNDNLIHTNAIMFPAIFILVAISAVEKNIGNS